jgi:ribonucleoside-diphosphate reductase alpha chain
MPTAASACTTYRPNPITGAVLEVRLPREPALAVASEAAPPTHVGAIDLMVRPEKMLGATYKLRWPDSEHAMYVTVNDIELDGMRRPFEVFVNSKNLEHYAWVVALTRMISAVFRRGGEVGFVAEELKQVFDPRGGQWMNGRYVGSLVAAIGNVLERHMIETGFLIPEDPPGIKATLPVAGPVTAAQLGPLCPKCTQPGLVKQSGCSSCLHCGWSKC